MGLLIVASDGLVFVIYNQELKSILVITIKV